MKLRLGRFSLSVQKQAFWVFLGVIVTSDTLIFGLALLTVRVSWRDLDWVMRQPIPEVA